MSYLRRKFNNFNCDICGGLVSLIIAMHIIIALIVIGVNHYNKTQHTKKPEITNGKHK